MRKIRASPHLSGTLKAVLSCKLVRLVLRVAAQLDQEMVGGDTLCGLRPEQQRGQQHHQSRRCRPVSGRPAHRVRLASVRPSACSSWVGGGGGWGVGGKGTVYGMFLAREEGEGIGGGGCATVAEVGVESKHLLAGRW